MLDLVSNPSNGGVKVFITDLVNIQNQNRAIMAAFFKSLAGQDANAPVILSGCQLINNGSNNVVTDGLIYLDGLFLTFKETPTGILPAYIIQKAPVFTNRSFRDGTSHAVTVSNEAKLVNTLPVGYTGQVITLASGVYTVNDYVKPNLNSVLHNDWVNLTYNPALNVSINGLYDGLSANGGTDSSFANYFRVYKTGKLVNMMFIIARTSAIQYSGTSFYGYRAIITGVPDNLMVTNNGIGGNAIGFYRNGTFRSTAYISIRRGANPGEMYLQTLVLDMGISGGAASGTKEFSGTIQYETNTL